MKDTVLFKTKHCVVCHKHSVMEISAAGYQKWNDGAFVQDAFPELSSGEREMLITGTHPQCWQSLFPPEEDEYEDPYENEN